jgi:hypothetical protein
MTNQLGYLTKYIGHYTKEGCYWPGGFDALSGMMEKL